jgi:hypothetical protein
MSLPNQGDGRSQGQLRASKGMRSAGGIGQPHRAPRRPRCSLLSGRRVTPSRPLPLRRNAAVTVRQLGRYAGVTAQPTGCNTVSAGAVKTGDRIANETADSLRSAVLVGACGAFVAVLRNHAKIVRAHANRESPKLAARPLPQGSHSLSR